MRFAILGLLLGCGALDSSTTIDASGDDDAKTVTDATRVQDVDADDATMPTGCPSINPVPYFCMDFDEGNARIGYWQGEAGTTSPITIQSAGVTGGLDQTRGHSPPGSVRFAFDQPGRGGEAFLEQTLDVGAWHGARFRAYVRFDSAAATTHTWGTLLRIMFGTDWFASVIVSVDMTEASADGGGASIGYQMSVNGTDVKAKRIAPPPFAQWLLLDLRVALGSTPAHAELRVDGIPLPPLDANAVGITQTNKLQLLLGVIGFNYSDTVTSINYDDVSLMQLQ